MLDTLIQKYKDIEANKIASIIETEIDKEIEKQLIADIQEAIKNSGIERLKQLKIQIKSGMSSDEEIIKAKKFKK